jgi:hypothetical protein
MPLTPTSTNNGIVLTEAMGHLHPPIILGRVNAIDPYIDEQWDCLNRSGGCYIAFLVWMGYIWGRVLMDRSLTQQGFQLKLDCLP